jgi:GntR family transcriptional regulator
MTEAGSDSLKPQRVSLSQQAQHYLRGLIDAGSYRPGDRLPSQADLAAQLGISRLTLREALLGLEQEGVILLRHGIGTFVSPSYRHRLESGLERLESILELAARQGFRLTCVDLQVTRQPADQELALVLRVPVSTPLTRVGRTLQAGAQPVAYMIDVTPGSILAPEEIGPAFDGSVLNFLKRKPDVHLAHAVAGIRAISAGPELGSRLKVEPGQALQLLEETLFGRDGTPVGFSRNYFVPDFFQFRVVRR